MDQAFSSYVIWTQGQNLTISRSNVSKLQIFLKNRFDSNFYLCSPLTPCLKSEKSLELFLRKLRCQPTYQPNIKVSDFGLIWRGFCGYLQINNFFQISSSVTFLSLQSPNFLPKIRKILGADSISTSNRETKIVLFKLGQSYTRSGYPKYCSRIRDSIILKLNLLASLGNGICAVYA